MKIETLEKKIKELKKALLFCPMKDLADILSYKIKNGEVIKLEAQLEEAKTKRIIKNLRQYISKWEFTNTGTGGLDFNLKFSGSEHDLMLIKHYYFPELKVNNPR